jgi:hypothetical protein
MSSSKTFILFKKSTMFTNLAGIYNMETFVPTYALKQLEVASCFHYSLSMHNNFYATLCIKDSIRRHRKLLHGEE